MDADITLKDIKWLTGSWRGSLGPMTVEESWMAPSHGYQQMMIRLSGPEGIQMLEFIVIREIQDAGSASLVLHLRQFSPDMEMVTNQDMQVIELADNAVSFAAGPDASIPRLDYILEDSDRLRVQVTTAGGDVLAAELDRA